MTALSRPSIPRLSGQAISENFERPINTPGPWYPAEPKFIESEVRDSPLKREFFVPNSFRPSVPRSTREPRGHALPRVTSTCLRPPVPEKLVHVIPVEKTWMRLGEIVTDVRKIEGHPVPLCRRVHSVQISDAVACNQGCDCTSCDAQCAPLCLAWRRRQFCIPNNVGGPSTFKRGAAPEGN